jgi:transposase
MTTKGKRYPAEVRERAVRLVLEHRGEYQTEWAAICSIAQKCGMTAETLRKWVRQVEVDGGRRPGVSSDEAARIKELERENKELRRANEILKAARLSSRGSSTRSQGDEPGGGRQPRTVRGRADLQSSGDRPIDVLRSEGQAGGSLGAGCS